MSCANGQQEQITEIGSYGPIAGAQKVLSSPRTLVSVADLVEQVGITVFDRKGGFVCSGGSFSEGNVVTRIGSLTPQRLYSFDLPSLQRHCSEMERRGLAPPSSFSPSTDLRTWGCASGATSASA